MIKIAAKSKAEEIDLKRTEREIIYPLKEESISTKAHEVFLPANISFPSNRAENLDDFCAKNDIESIAYHVPVVPLGENKKRLDLAYKNNDLLDITLKCIDEMENLSVDDKRVIIHSLGITDSLNNRTHQILLENTIESLKEIKKTNYRICLENNVPDSTSFGAMISLCMHPKELIYVCKNAGVDACLDFAHFQLFYNYEINGKGYANADFQIERYGFTDWDETIGYVSPYLSTVHINDAKGYTIEYEGIEVGNGDVPFSRLIPKLSKNNLFGTFEIINLHIKPEVMVRSVKKLKEMFGDKFYSYFDC